MVTWTFTHTVTCLCLILVYSKHCADVYYGLLSFVITSFEEDTLGSQQVQKYTNQQTEIKTSYRVTAFILDTSDNYSVCSIWSMHHVKFLLHRVWLELFLGVGEQTIHANENKNHPTVCRFSVFSENVVIWPFTNSGCALQKPNMVSVWFWTVQWVCFHIRLDLYYSSSSPHCCLTNRQLRRYN